MLGPMPLFAVFLLSRGRKTTSFPCGRTERAHQRSSEHTAFLMLGPTLWVRPKEREGQVPPHNSAERDGQDETDSI